MTAKTNPKAKNAFIKNKDTKHPKDVKLALLLEGGGCYGAFTAGALVALLEYMRETPHITIDIISGTSAGAMNGGILTHAMNMHDDREQGINQAINDLTLFWNDIKIPGLAMSDEILFQLSIYAQLITRMYPFPMGEPQILSTLHNKLSKYVTDDAFLNMTGPNKIELYTNSVQIAQGTGDQHEMIHYSRAGTQGKAAIVASAALKDFGPHTDGNLALHSQHDSNGSIIHCDGAYHQNGFVPKETSPDHDVFAISLHSNNAPNTSSIYTLESLRKMHGLEQGDIIHNSLANELNRLAQEENGPRLHGIHHIPPQNASDLDRMIARAERVDSLREQGYNAMKDHLQTYGHLLGVGHTREQTIQDLQPQWNTRNNNGPQYSPYVA